VTMKEDEDKLRRSVAVQNADSIFVARQRAEQRKEFYLAEGRRLAHMGSWAFHPSGFFEYWSPEVFQIYGLDPTKGAPALNEYLATLHPQDRELMAGTIDKMLREGSGCDVKQRILRPGGENRYVRWVGVPVFDKEVIEGFVGVAMDVTEQENLAQELRRREAYAAEAQRLSHTGSFGWRVSSGEIRWSEETFQIFQYDRTTKPTLELILQRVHPEDRALLQQAIDRAIDYGRDFEHEHRLLMPNGSVKYVHVVARAVRDESRGIEFVGAVMDVTERKQVEDRERHRSRILESLTAGATLATILDSICRAIEVEDPTALCTIMLMDNDGKHLLHGAAPSMPRFFADAAHGIEIGEDIGSCGAAAYTKNRVVVEDLSSHPYWLPYRDLTQKAGLKSCWSEPILRANGEVLGTFGIYHRTPRSPDPDDVQRIKYAADFARLAIEYKQAEVGLKESEERFRLISENVTDLIAVVDLEGRRVYNSPSYKEILGDPEALHGTDSFNEIHPDDRDKIKATFEETVRTGVGQRAEYRFLLRDGSVRFIESQGSVIRDRQGRPANVVVVSRDITERRQAEAKLKEGEEKFRKAFMTGADAFYIATFDEGLIIEVNNCFQELFGFTSEEIIGKTSIQLGIYADPVDRARMVSEVKSRGSVRNLEIRARRKGGEIFPLLMSASLLQMGGKQLILGVLRDITERKRAEAENVRLVTAIEQSAEAVMITSADGAIEYVNPAFTGITGYSRAEVVGQNPRMLKSDKHEPAFYQQLWATILKGEIWHGEILNRRKDGTLRTEEMYIDPVRSGRGEITHFIATKLDVTERKHLEEQFRQAQKMEGVGRLAGGVAHDFNNLLTIINGYGELMLGRFESNDPMRGYLVEIMNAGNRAASLTRQLLAFSRQQVLAPRVLDLNLLVADVEKMLRRLIGEDIDLVMVQEPALGQVKADPGQLEQILMNLAINARDAMPEGGKLVIETANVELDDAYSRSHALVSPGRYVMLAVSDTGIGMDAGTQAHIFEPFFTTKEKDKGTGLGLATVYGIVKQSSGHIWVYSEPGRGTAFKIYLPRFEEVEESVHAPEARGHSVPGTETILLVEDEEAVRSLAVRVLQDLGYQLLESTSPEDALEIAERHKEPIDLLLTDVVMPRMSGRKVAEHLALMRPGMKVLCMSGYTDDAIVRHGVLEAGVAFLQKPFTPAALARKVREVLDARRHESS